MNKRMIFSTLIAIASFFTFKTFANLTVVDNISYEKTDEIQIESIEELVYWLQNQKVNDLKNNSFHLQFKSDNKLKILINKTRLESINNERSMVDPLP